MLEEAYIAAAMRTPIGKLGGALSSLAASDLGAAVIASLLNESGLENEAVSEVILGQVLTGDAGQNPARQAAMKAGPSRVGSGDDNNQVCGTGQRSIHLAAQSIRWATLTWSSPADRTA
jgi:acetyl-CoA C-acetyltransferase